VDKDVEWLCQICHKIERAWSLKDFGYDEQDPAEGIVMAINKAPAPRSPKASAKKAKVIECINLSSAMQEDVKIDDKGSTVFLYHENEHFFGSGHCCSYVTNDSIMSEPEADPFGNIDQNWQEGSPAQRPVSAKQ